ncbi:hypothetical protein [Nostoc sphaeroides]|uniref:Uncharacterized protein n=1 Tax=Nostoc sphaeroides CCNUC1 TaxID=2653204 RepID=A0A5P8WAC8_9NOSO|nr:hypothetical protein GXM_07048 [Nostoc sphaeroides CCNUC1]
MTDTPEYFPSRLDRLELGVLGLAERQSNTQVLLDNLALRQANSQIQLDELKREMRELTSNVDRVLSRSAILDDVLLELRDSHEEHQRNFEQIHLHKKRLSLAINADLGLQYALITVHPATTPTPSATLPPPCNKSFVPRISHPCG